MATGVCAILTRDYLAALATAISKVNYGFLLYSEREKMIILLPLGSVIPGFRVADDILGRSISWCLQGNESGEFGCGGGMSDFGGDLLYPHCQQFL